jgi:alanine racemase
MSPPATQPTRALIHLDRLTHNLRLLQELAGGVRLWPAVKANAYGHGAEIVAHHLVGLGFDTLCVAHAEEALELRAAGVDASFLVMSAALPEQAEFFVEHRLEPAVSTLAVAEALDRAAARAGRVAEIHLAIDTGMGRIGIPPDAVRSFLTCCAALSHVRVRGLMSHFPRADESDKSFSVEQIASFARVRDATRDLGDFVCHLANSAGLLDLPDSRFDAVRPGISIYGLAPSPTIQNPRVRELRSVLEWKTRITLLKEVPEDVGLSYGHTFTAARPTLVATLPVGYGDGLRRSLSNRLEVLVAGRRCPQIGTITMDQCLIDVTELRGSAEVGDEVVLIGDQGGASIPAEELAEKLGTVNYEIVTAISRRVLRVAIGGAAEP